MSYKKFPEEAASEADNFWYRKSDFLGAILAIKDINFSIVQQRQNALAQLQAIPHRIIVAPDVRFPAIGTYFHMGMGNIAKVYVQLTSSLNYKESSKHRSEPIKTPEKPGNGKVSILQNETGHATGFVVEFNSEDDAMLGFHNAIATVQATLSIPYSTLGRTGFETRFALEWSDKTE